MLPTWHSCLLMVYMLRFRISQGRMLRREICASQPGAAGPVGPGLELREEPLPIWDAAHPGAGLEVLRPVFRPLHSGGGHQLCSPQGRSPAFLGAVIAIPCGDVIVTPQFRPWLQSPRMGSNCPAPLTCAPVMLGWWKLRLAFHHGSWRSCLPSRPRGCLCGWLIAWERGGPQTGSVSASQRG